MAVFLSETGLSLFATHTILEELPGLKKPSSKIPPFETRVWSPVRVWFAETLVRAARELWLNKQKKTMKRERQNCGFLILLVPLPPMWSLQGEIKNAIVLGFRC
ncbi:hypothetical protein CR513_30882, partial [Mucuna pruriens]